jgi:hypothetical protein
VGVWLDEEQLVPSQSLVEEIDRALGKMTHFVMFWSSTCVELPWVKKELNAAMSLLIERTIPLFVVRLDSTQVPTIIADIYRIEAINETPEQIGCQIANAVRRLEKSSSDAS